MVVLKNVIADQAKRLKNVVNVLGATLGLKKGTVKATTPSKTVNKALETVQKHPFATAAIATGAIGAAKAAAPAIKTAIPSILTAAKSSIPSIAKASAPTAAKVATTVAAVGLVAPSLITPGNVAKTAGFAIAPQAAGAALVVETVQKGAKGFSSLSTGGKVAVAGGGIAAAAAATALVALGAKAYKSGAAVLDNPSQITSYARELEKKSSDKLLKTPSEQVPKVVSGTGIQDLTTPTETGISAYKENAPVEVIAKPITRRKKRKVFKPKPSSQSVKQNVINQVYVGG